LTVHGYLGPECAEDTSDEWRRKALELAEAVARAEASAAA
jgi:hypothetical protein